MSNDYDESAAEVIERLAQASQPTETVELVPGHTVGIVYAVTQQLHEVNLDQFNEHPERKTGNVELGDVDSFVTYVGRHVSSRATTLWGNSKAGTILAVLNDHEHNEIAPGEPGWADHRARLTLEPTTDWLVWTKHDGNWISQIDFAELIEDLAHTILIPEAATMLELAQRFDAKRDVKFSSGTRLQDGQTKLHYDETQTAKAGQHGDIDIPRDLVISVAPFVGYDPVEMIARFRWRIGRSNELLLGYKLIRPDLVRDEAFEKASVTVHEQTGQPVLTGTARGTR
jgi:uncharacterized protein YfdQ (DUF2303 family)